LLIRRVSDVLALLAAASIITAVDAERAFIADSHTSGQWTAFRKWADDDAIMFVPQPVWAQQFLTDRKDPPRSIDWAPADSWVSCDGQTAINRGPWTSASGERHGYFTTVWSRSHGQWRWIYDGGSPLTVPIAAPSRPRLTRASCSHRPNKGGGKGDISSATRADGDPPVSAEGRSADGTLTYEWKVAADGARHFEAKLWDGRTYRTITSQYVAAPSE
jgi:hypothetical protein